MRPLSKEETRDGFGWRVESNTICQAQDQGGRDTKYTLDHVFGPDRTTVQIYQATTQPIVQKVLSGFNGTVFAYGQTSSGKTYTMRGYGQEPGIITLAVQEIFDRISKSQDREFLLRVSYMEVSRLPSLVCCCRVHRRQTRPRPPSSPVRSP